MVEEKSGEKVYENIYSAIFDKNNNFQGSLIVTNDITENRKFEREKMLYQLKLEHKINELEESNYNMLISFISGMINTIEARDPFLRGHSIRVSEYAEILAENYLGLSTKVHNIELAAKLHDIGKIGVRETILNKKEKLTDVSVNLKLSDISFENCASPK